MARDIQFSSLDLDYEDHRVKDAEVEVRLRGSIQMRCIRKPLEDVDVEEDGIPLNGFQRNRCVKRQDFGVVPCASFGGNEAVGIFEVLRVVSERGLAVFESERAESIGELVHHVPMNVAEIAETLSRSKPRGVMRLGLVGEVGEEERKRVLGGRFTQQHGLATCGVSGGFVDAPKPARRARAEFLDARIGREMGNRSRLRVGWPRPCP